MKGTLARILLLGTLMVGCKGAEPKSCYLYRVIFKEGELTRETTYTSDQGWPSWEYTTTEQPGSYSEYQVFYEHDANGRLKKAEKFYQQLGRDYITYYYDGQNRLVRINSTPEFGTVSTAINYEYNSSGQLIGVDTVTSTGSTGTRTTVTLTYPNTTTKNPSSMISEPDGGPATEFLMEYDDKKNPMGDFFPSVQTTNNVTKRTVNGVTENITYYYNSLNYPDSAVSQLGYKLRWLFTCK